jgi:hypothetical protein
VSTPENLMPGESALPVVNVIESGPDGVAFDGFGFIRVRACEGRELEIEIENGLTGHKMTAVIDWGRPKRAHAHLEADALQVMIAEASRGDGIGSAPFPALH